MKTLFLYVFLIFLSLTTLAMAFYGRYEWRWETTDVKRGFETCRFNGTKFAKFDLKKDYSERVCVFNCPFSANILLKPQLGTHKCKWGDTIRVDDSHKGF